MSANISNEELLLKTVFEGFKIRRYQDGSYYISHEEREVTNALLQKLRENKIKQDNDRAMRLADFVFEYGGNPCIIFQKDELPLLEGHTFDAEFFLLQLGLKEKEKMPEARKPAGSQTGSSYVASSERWSPTMWGKRNELPPLLKGTSETFFQKKR